MKNISADTILKIKDVPIVDIGKTLGLPIKKNKCDCFTGHDRNSPSLSFDKKRNIFKCFGCGIGGDGIELVKIKEKKSFKEACEWIIAEFKISVVSSLWQDKVYKKNNPKQRKQLKKITVQEDGHTSNPEIYEWIIANTVLSEASRSYLVNTRGFNTQIIDAYNIRDIVNTESFYSTLVSQWGTDILLRCGLITVNEYKNIRPVWWTPVIIFPFTNLNYQVSYIQARSLLNSKSKYLNLSGVKPTIYNLDRIASWNPGDDIFFCEGVPDTLSAVHMDIKAVGVLGSNGFKEEWVNYFRDFSINVIPDRDSGGERFSESIRQHFKTIGKEIRTVHIAEPFKDLNEYFISRNSRNQ